MGLTRRLDVRVTLLQPIRKALDRGAHDTQWVPWSEDWIAFEATPARELLATGGEQAVVMYQGTLRYRQPPIGCEWTDLRVERDGEVFDVAAARPVGRRQILVLDLVQVRS